MALSFEVWSRRQQDGGDDLHDFHDVESVTTEQYQIVTGEEE